ncbi:MAG: Asp-tRNA(Asn)/Glu-tRNA(Gln) amidotransferase subunit GatC [Gammaproteobacteria bacterium]|nr:Asp-tRNA(Asn)/Glu-tRNA(Gln) amidotransferase subunit GatC [Gammaproteobacteria bacterium]
MPITREQIARIAHLARLATAPAETTEDAEAAEAEEYAAQLSRILELVEQMNRIDTNGVAPLSHPQQLAEAALRLRADEVTETDRRADYQRIAPAAEDGLYLVPRVIE